MMHETRADIGQMEASAAMLHAQRMVDAARELWRDLRQAQVRQCYCMVRGLPGVCDHSVGNFCGCDADDGTCPGKQMIAVLRKWAWLAEGGDGE